MEFDIDYDGMSPWLIALALTLAVAISYPVGYVLLDVVEWVKIPSEAQQVIGAVHVARVFLGAIVLGVLGGVFMLWEPREALVRLNAGTQIDRL